MPFSASTSVDTVGRQFAEYRPWLPGFGLQQCIQLAQPHDQPSHTSLERSLVWQWGAMGCASKTFSSGWKHNPEVFGIWAVSNVSEAFEFAKQFILSRLWRRWFVVRILLLHGEKLIDEFIVDSRLTRAVTTKRSSAVRTRVQSATSFSNGGAHTSPAVESTGKQLKQVLCQIRTQSSITIFVCGERSGTAKIAALGESVGVSIVPSGRRLTVNHCFG